MKSPLAQLMVKFVKSPLVGQDIQQSEVGTKSPAYNTLRWIFTTVKVGIYLIPCLSHVLNAVA